MSSGKPNPAGAGNGGMASPLHSWLGIAAVPDQHRWARSHLPMRAQDIARIATTCWVLFLCCSPWMSLQSQTNFVYDQTGTNMFYSASGKWITASNTNCLIWSSFPRVGETATWSGSVIDAKAHGTGVVQWFTNGIPTSRYAGEMKAGRQDGHGTSFYYNLFSVEGEFKDGGLISKIVIVRNSGEGWYKGEHIDGVKNGQGEEVMKGGVRYSGRFKQGRFDGAGVMIWPNGDRLTGDWKDSQLAGIGTLTRTNGESIRVNRTEKGIERAP